MRLSHATGQPRQPPPQPHHWRLSRRALTLLLVLGVLASVAASAHTTAAPPPPPALPSFLLQRHSPLHAPLLQGRRAAEQSRTHKGAGEPAVRMHTPHEKEPLECVNGGERGADGQCVCPLYYTGATCAQRQCPHSSGGRGADAIVPVNPHTQRCDHCLEDRFTGMNCQLCQNDAACNGDPQSGYHCNHSLVTHGNSKQFQCDLNAPYFLHLLGDGRDISAQVTVNCSTNDGSALREEGNGLCHVTIYRVEPNASYLDPFFRCDATECRMRAGVTSDNDDGDNPDDDDSSDDGGYADHAQESDDYDAHHSHRLGRIRTRLPRALRRRRPSRARLAALVQRFQLTGEVVLVALCSALTLLGLCGAPVLGPRRLRRCTLALTTAMVLTVCVYVLGMMIGMGAQRGVPTVVYECQHTRCACAEDPPAMYTPICSQSSILAHSILPSIVNSIRIACVREGEAGSGGGGGDCTLTMEDLSLVFDVRCRGAECVNTSQFPYWPPTSGEDTGGGADVHPSQRLITGLFVLVVVSCVGVVGHWQYTRYRVRQLAQEFTRCFHLPPDTVGDDDGAPQEERTVSSRARDGCNVPLLARARDAPALHRRAAQCMVRFFYPHSPARHDGREETVEERDEVGALAARAAASATSVDWRAEEHTRHTALVVAHDNQPRMMRREDNSVLDSRNDLHDTRHTLVDTRIAPDTTRIRASTTSSSSSVSSASAAVPMRWAHRAAERSAAQALRRRIATVMELRACGVRYSLCGAQLAGASSAEATGRVILRSVSFAIHSGEVMAIMGPSGAGKTTLLDLLSARAKSGGVGGTIYINGTPVTQGAWSEPMRVHNDEDEDDGWRVWDEPHDRLCRAADGGCREKAEQKDATHNRPVHANNIPPPTHVNDSHADNNDDDNHHYDNNDTPESAHVSSDVVRRAAATLSEVRRDAASRACRRRRARDYANIVGYVSQEDTLLPGLTVRQTITYAARLKLPMAFSTRTIGRIVAEVIRTLRLESCADTLVGDGAYIRGISGGQKRRVSIAVELLANPRLLFLDEPTSGLDAVSARHVMEAVVALSRNSPMRQYAPYYFAFRPIVILSIHQPSKEIYEMFDKVLLLSDGVSIYCGEAAQAAGRLAQDVHWALRAANSSREGDDAAAAAAAEVMVPPCRPHDNPAEYLMRLEEMLTPAARTALWQRRVRRDDGCVSADMHAMHRGDATTGGVDADEQHHSRDNRARTAAAVTTCSDRIQSGTEQPLDSSHTRIYDSHSNNNSMPIRAEGSNSRSGSRSGSSTRAAPLLPLATRNDSAAEEQLQSQLQPHDASSPAVASTPLLNYTRVGGDEILCMTSSFRRYYMDVYSQMRLLTSRATMCLMTSYHLICCHAAVVTCLASLMCFLYPEQKLDLPGAMNRAGGMSFLLLVTSFVSLSSLEQLIIERKLFVLERENGFYSTFPYLLSKMAVDIAPLRVVPALVLTSVIYFPMGYRADEGMHFFWFILIVVLFSVSMTLMILCIGIAAGQFGAAALLSSVFIMWNFVFGGTLVQAETIPFYLRPFKSLSPFFLAFESLMVNELDGQACVFSPTDETGKPSSTSIPIMCVQYLANLGLKPGRFGADVMQLALYCFLFFIVAWVLLAWCIKIAR